MQPTNSPRMSLSYTLYSTTGESTLDSVFTVLKDNLCRGVMFLTSAPHALDITEDGYDIQWATNALGIYLIPLKEIPVVISVINY
jgi:hypothetical protein